MPKKVARKPVRKNVSKVSVFGWDLASYLDTATDSRSAPNDGNGVLYYVGEDADIERFTGGLESTVTAWQLGRAFKRERELSFLAAENGPIWVARPKRARESELYRDGGVLRASPYAKARDLMGAVFSHIEGHELKTLTVRFMAATDDEKLGALVGLELAAYRYQRARDEARSAKHPWPRLVIEGVSSETIAEATVIGTATNVARHLVNTPANELTPVSYADAIKTLFAAVPGVSVEVWDERRLEKEGMGLHLGVGQGAEYPPRLVHVSYRPVRSSKGGRKRPVAFVGKGITFDSGGLDIKPSDGMRLMKKDMGGSAALVGLAYWASRARYGEPLDFYFALAENAIDERSFRPGDVLKARSGLTVEIHNTDAEGRLVLADAIDVALSKKGADEPSEIIDVATLTGAVKVGIGMDLAGLFANDDSLGGELLHCAQAWGDKAWRMPLYAPYESQLKSHVADVSNCSNSRFAGAITAALFLEKFVGHKPWAHFDIYAWADQAHGALREQGGSGQAVQCLIGFLARRVG